MATRVVFALCLVLSGLMACTAMLAGGNGASAGRPVGQDTRSSATAARDEQLSAIIRRRFAADQELARATLDVRTRQGVVTIRGTVPAFEQRDRAIRLAGDVDGVVRVQNQISVQSR